MRSITVHFTSGNSITTSINGDRERILSHYPKGGKLNVGRGEHDYWETIDRVQFHLFNHQQEESLEHIARALVVMNRDMERMPKESDLDPASSDALAELRGGLAIVKQALAKLGKTV